MGCLDRTAFGEPAWAEGSDINAALQGAGHQLGKAFADGWRDLEAYAGQAGRDDQPGHAVVRSSGRISARQLADTLNLSYQTARRMRRRIHASLSADGQSAQQLRKLADTWARQAPQAAGSAANLGRPEDRIRAAACRVMAERGATAARIADIAAAAGVSASSIHYYWN